MVIATPATMTVEEFFKLHGNESNVELVHGQIVRYPVPGARHGRVCTNASFVFESFARQSNIGRTFSNDTLIRISSDTTRGADVFYVSFTRLPVAQKVSDGILNIAPELVIEVRSPSDLWTDSLGKMLDYLRIGVLAVVILDPKTESASVFRSGARQETFEEDETLTLPDVLPGFEVAVARFFEE